MIAFPGGRFEDDRIGMFRSIAALTTAGFTLVEAIEDTATGASDPALKSAIASILSDVKSGAPLSTALQGHPRIAGPIEIALIRSGERSGNMSDALDTTATLCEERHGLRMELAAAMIYPSLVIILAAAAVLFLTQSVIPGLAELYAASGRTLPLITRCLSGVAFVIPGGLVLIALWIFAHRNGWIPHTSKSLGSSLLMRIPMTRRMLDAQHTSLWASIIARLLDNGSILTDSVRLAGSAMPTDLAAVFSRIASQLEEGVPPGQAFCDQPSLPPLARRLVESGDRSGDIAHAMHQIAGLFRTRYEMQRRKVTALAEPLAILIAGTIILFLALGIILPATDLGALIE